MSEGVSAAFANYMAATESRALPSVAMDAARMSLIDTFACAQAAFRAPETKPAMQVLLRGQSQGKASVWGCSAQCLPEDAACLNSLTAAVLDYDSVFHRGIVHSDLVVVPTAVAVAQEVHATGRDLLAAIALGSDMLCRLSLAPEGERKGWFFTSVFGGIVAASITARLLGCSESRVLDAMGIAFLMASGTYQPMDERSPSKQAMAALAVQSGIRAGYLAAAGMAGVCMPIEGRHGIAGLYQNCDFAPTLENLGSQFLGTEIGRKPYPSCQCNHAPIEASLAMIRDEKVSPHDVEEIDLLLSPHACDVVGAPFDPHTSSRMAAQFSAQFSVAATFVRGRFGLEEIGAAAITDPDIANLARRVNIVSDPQNRNTYVPATLIVRTKAGATFERTVYVNRGSSAAPLTLSEIKTKFIDCAVFGKPSCNTMGATADMDRLAKIESMGDVSTLFGNLA